MNKDRFEKEKLREKERLLELASSASFRKLLSSHLSIYNALTNPDLDFNTPNSPKERFATPPPLEFPAFADPSASLQSWQSINLNTESMQDIARQLRLNSPLQNGRPPSASILSSTSDEDGGVSDSVVIVPTSKKGTSKVMVFETDEEDDGDDNELGDLPGKAGAFSAPELGNDDEKTLTSDINHSSKYISVPQNLHNSFIMPKMSLSDSGKKFQLTFLSSSDDVLRLETNDLVRFIQRNVDVSSLKMQVTHLALALRALKFDLSLIRSSDLLFIINDGSLVFAEFLATVCQAIGKSELPKLTVINIMTSNYFINLFDIINNMKPYQIWKTPSLKNEKLMHRMKGFIENELDSGGGYAQELNAKRMKFWRKSKTGHPKAGSKSKHENAKSNDDIRTSESMYDSLIPSKKPDYKVIERQIRSEMLISLSYGDIDPLKLSSNLHHLNTLVTLFKRMFAARSSLQVETVPSGPWALIPSGKVWLFCSFSIGIGVGMTVASGAATVCALYIYDLGAGYLGSDTVSTSLPNQQLMAVVGAGHFDTGSALSKLSAVSDSVASVFGRCSQAMVDALLSTVDNLSVSGAVAWFSSYLQDLRAVSSFAAVSARGGLEKAMGLLTSFFG